MLLRHALIPLKYLCYAFQAFVYLINTMPATLLGFKTHFECLHNKIPSYINIKKLGVYAIYEYVHMLQTNYLHNNILIFVSIEPLKGYN